MLLRMIRQPPEQITNDKLSVERGRDFRSAARQASYLSFVMERARGPTALALPRTPASQLVVHSYQVH